MTKPPLVSVVTPFYNSADYLQECIESVLEQSYENFEYILLDNCSSDNSSDIARDFASKDSRITLHVNERLLPQVENYNYALSKISPDSTYCKIVQADDWIFRTCLEDMVANAESDDCIGIISAYRLVGSQVKHVGLPYSSKVLSGKDVCRMQILEGSFFFGSPTSIMYRSEIVRARRPFFSLGRLHEDTEACYEILQSWKFGFVHQVLSFSRVDDDSTMGRVLSFNPYLLDKLIIAKLFGERFLGAQEFSDAWGVIERQYLRFLAEAKLRGQSEEFWSYHRRGLETIGYEVRDAKVYWQMLAWVCDLVLNPKRTIEQLLRRSK